jgi:hypothetical protein
MYRNVFLGLAYLELGQNNESEQVILPLSHCRSILTS